jgi:transposase-like protein
MKRRTFGREFKIEAVKLIREGGVSVAQASRDLDVHENVLRKWVKARSSGGAGEKSVLSSSSKHADSIESCPMNQSSQP